MKFDKQELEKKIRDAKDLSNEDKSNLLGLLNEKKTYGLVWEDSTEDAFEQLKTQLPILREVKDRQIVNDTETKHYPNHILIEGENLQALVALTYTHAGMIDVIYIDPPYNTGNKDFIYNDSFIGEDDSYRHSKWLSFMEKRLNIAKTLLSEKAVIFISIDDNEQANLRSLCDSIFGEGKFIANIIWQKKTGAADAKGIAVITEYILVYCNSYDKIDDIFAKNKEAFDLKRYRFKDDYEERRGPFYYDSLDRGSVRYSDSLNYGISAPDGTMLFPNDRTVFLNDGWTWKWSKEKVDWGIKNGFIEIVKNEKKKSGWSVKYKIYLNVDNEGNYIKKNVPYKNLINDVLNADASNDIKELFGNKAFNYAKPTKLVEKLLRIIEGKDILILDFFAGSGTTMHATMQLNKEDGGHRQCILVTNNENGICENVTYERNKRVIEGYTKPNSDYVEGLTNNNLRYYKIDFKERKQSHQSNRELFHEMKDLLCIKEDIYQEKHQFGSLPLKGKERMIRYFAENGREMLMIYDTRVIPFIVKEIEKMSEKELPLKIYIFADGAYPYTDDFATVIDKVSLVPMPYAFYRGIKDSLPDAETKKEDSTELTDEEQKQMMAEAIEAENNEKKED